MIKDYKVTSKEVVKLPDSIESIVKCFNPNCITNHEKVNTKFTVIDKSDVKLRCHYCEKITDKKNMNFIEIRVLRKFIQLVIARAFSKQSFIQIKIASRSLY